MTIDATLVAILAITLTLIVHSILLGRWGGMLTEKVKQNAEQIEAIGDNQKRHEERLRMVENAVVRFEVVADRISTRGEKRGDARAPGV